LDEAVHPLGADDSVEPALTFLGAPNEGLLVFQLTAARPQSNSTVLNQAARWAEDLVNRLVGPEPGR
jgi:hypothetical protein